MRHDEYHAELMEQQAKAFAKLAAMRGVDDAFKDALVAIAGPAMGSPWGASCLSDLDQLSECGAGMFGARQSDRADDVVMRFCRSLQSRPLVLRLRGDVLYMPSHRLKATFPEDQRERHLLVTRFVNAWEGGGYDPAPSREDIEAYDEMSVA